MASHLARPRALTASVGPHADPEPDALFIRFPALFEFLVLSAWEDGTRRATGTMLLSYSEERWRLWLHDRDAERSCWLSGLTPLGVWEAAEAVLGGGEGEWRRDQPGSSQKRRGRG